MAERDYGAEAQKVAEAHIMACWDWYQDDETVDGHPQGDDPASAPFDGCPTCEVREILYAAWPLIEAGVVEGGLCRDDVIKAGIHS